MKKKVGSALVVGAGVSGIRSALDLAEIGYRVVLIEKAPNLGGILRQLDYQFPTDHCGMCKMLPLVDRDSSSQFCLRKGLFHENIEIMLSTELTAVEGEPGKFQVTLYSRPELVDQQRCIGCGECSRICPVEVPDEYNAGLSLRKAIYLPVPHSIPNRYTVDTDACTRCGKCQKACPTGAIDLQLEARREFRVLVVDDELVVRDSTKEWLEEEGFSVDMAESGMEALDKLSHQRYHLVFLDVKMPGLDGVEVLKRAKEMYPDLPIVMMTAYATVETAVEAMKFGALDYLMKPFDVEALLAMTVRLFQETKRPAERRMEVGAIILAGGFRQFDPLDRNDLWGYGELPGVVTSVEFERMLSGTGPTAGRLIRPDNGEEIRRVAWIQCVGSRDRNHDADFCSSICCMYSIKEAVLTREMTGGEADATIFYMDMRTFGKDFQAYRNKAEDELGVRFVRSRVHTVEPEKDGRLRLTYTGIDGTQQDESFDVVVLATGQRPAAASQALAEITGVELNPWGFCQATATSLTRTAKEGVFLSGSFGTPCDISDSIIQAGSAAFALSSLIHSKGGGMSVVSETERPCRDVSRETPEIAAVLCNCGGAVTQGANLDAAAQPLMDFGDLSHIVHVDRLCTSTGWEALQEQLKGSRFNRLLIGACMPYAYGRHAKEMGKSLGLAPALVDAQDIRSPTLPGNSTGKEQTEALIRSALAMGAAKLRGMDTMEAASIEICRKALIVGGGIAGLTAALGIADHGYDVFLVEKDCELGGNLRRLYRTIEGFSPQEMLKEAVSRVEAHPGIRTFKNAEVIHAQGQVGRFITTIRKEDGSVEALPHGVTLIATGGREATVETYGYGHSSAVVTQHEFEEKLHKGILDPNNLMSVAMIQCVGSRVEGRNYCSRICCTSALKNALFLKERNPGVEVYVFYRDLMSYGFFESSFSEARKAGVIFIQYSLECMPQVHTENGSLKIEARDPILGRPISILPDVLVLGTGIIPSDHAKIAHMYHVGLDEHGFLQEAEYKWRPVDSLQEGVFLCGIAHSPRSIRETTAMAEAAAQRSLRILSSDRLAGGSVSAEIRESLCSLCERCIDACPYGARMVDEDEDKVVVNALMCQGCGTCAAVCPNGAAFLRGYRDQQVFAMINAAMDCAS